MGRGGAFIACLVTLVTGVALLAPAVQGATPPVPLGPATAKRWTPPFMTAKNSFTHDEAIATALNYDLIVVQPFALSAAFVNDMHAANPSVKILAYVNGAFTKVTTYPEAYYGHDLLGARVNWIPFGLTTLEMSNANARATVGDAAQAALAAAPYDGVLLDNLGLTVLNTSDKTGAIVVPVPGLQILPPAIPLLPYLGADWLSYTSTLVREIRNRFITSFVMGNGLARGNPYFAPLAPTAVLSSAAQAMESEEFVRAAGDGVTTYRNETNWKTDVEMIIDSERRGAAVTSMTKVWVTATAAQKEAWHRYAFATFLLGTNGTSYFAFLGDRLLNTSITPKTIENASIGTPVTTYAKIAGVYQRTYTQGLVLVNPTTASVTVPITGTFTNLDGATVTTSIVMAPHTGQVLTHS